MKKNIMAAIICLGVAAIMCVPMAMANTVSRGDAETRSPVISDCGFRIADCKNQDQISPRPSASSAVNTYLLYCGIGLALAAALGMAGPAIKDALLKKTKALPNGANSTQTDPIDTGKTTDQGVQPPEVEFLVTAPELSAAQLASATTVSYSVLTSDHLDMSSATTLMPSVLVQTGATGTGGADAAEYKFRLPSAAQQFVSLKATKTGAADASAAEMSLEPLF